MRLVRRAKLRTFTQTNQNPHFFCKNLIVSCSKTRGISCDVLPRRRWSSATITEDNFARGCATAGRRALVQTANSVRQLFLSLHLAVVPPRFHHAPPSAGGGTSPVRRIAGRVVSVVRQLRVGPGARLRRVLARSSWNAAVFSRLGARTSTFSTVAVAWTFFFLAPAEL